MNTDSNDDDGANEGETVRRERKERQERQDKAFAAMKEAVKEYAEAAYGKGWFAGWEEGFSDGWAAALDTLKKKEEAGRTSRFPVAPGADSRARAHLGRPKRLSSYEIVRNYIEANPGKRGVEIATALSAELPERTVRTALHRLRGAKIANVEGRWYVTGATPAPPPRLLEEE
ncbi:MULTISPECIES: hypothetical protein [Bradyrhizobium]|uniref:Uncharacterized protein n=1 Tax=Bradyrhizobium elkanii TaxID=29448 RepID=A0A8I2BZ08_BRAEL|nr:MULTISPECIES: hypothetical protein [Bradyrhizobium]MBP1292400.1 hypothetical protein [Bradyrhizobium elkanii]MCP1927097.1 hypothetical protein [Bradyrhizobium elkanii]MCS3475379.1 hypothetical protein [Bradyrhizobium elkanii]MCS3582226.1 hypothetical protein [Bradyrhizobium elkanii]MCS3715793.1 hypothetical protein [Bradyrhizobium elkanii]